MKEYYAIVIGTGSARSYMPLMEWAYSKNTERTNTPCDIAYKENQTQQ